MEEKAETSTSRGAINKSTSKRDDGAEGTSSTASNQAIRTIVAVVIPKYMDVNIERIQRLSIETSIIVHASAKKTTEKKEERPRTSKKGGGRQKHDIDDDIIIVGRNRWKAIAPKKKLMPRKSPFPVVVVNEICLKQLIPLNKCVQVVKHIQEDSMEHLDDIISHFVIGKNGYVYEGRGWSNEGESEEVLNIDFAVTFMEDIPSQRELDACQRLIREGVRLGYIDKNYMLYSYPFNKLYYEVMKWENFVPCF